MKKILLTALWVVSISVYGQVNFNTQYTNAKQLFKEGKYNLAMESFKTLIPYDQNNPFSEYAAFYYAVSAYHLGYLAVAREQFNQIKTLYPKWDKIDEVNLWLAQIHFRNNEHFQGLKLLAGISDKKFHNDIDALKAKALQDINDEETLNRMHQQYLKDEVIARAYARLLAKDLADANNKKQLEKLIDEFKWKRGDFIPEAPKTFRKERYSVSVMMPFMTNTLEPSPGRKRNQIILDFYEGMKLAIDTLNKQGPVISLRAYDTERDQKKIQTILNTEELKNTDLVIGPFFQDENKPLQEFSINNRINIINPFLNNLDIVGQNPYGFLFQPSYETLGAKSGEFLASYVSNKDCMVFYGPSTRDSVLAANFIREGKEKGLVINGAYRIQRENTKPITDILATPTELDEFKYPKEFLLKKDSLGCIYVATDEALIYTKVLEAVETRGDKIVVLGLENWLEQTAIDLDKFYTLPIVLAAPNFTSPDDPQYKTFFKNYIRKHGRLPSQHAKIGFELMMFAGSQLKQNGVYFQQVLNEIGKVPGYLSAGYNYQYSRSNQLVPFVRWIDGSMKVIDTK